MSVVMYVDDYILQQMLGLFNRNFINMFIVTLDQTLSTSNTWGGFEEGGNFETCKSAHI